VILLVSDWNNRNAAAAAFGELLLLDEHTAALGPKSADLVIALTEQVIASGKLTTLMVTHSMHQAASLGDRLIMMHRGQIIHDLQGAENAACGPMTCSRVSRKCGAPSNWTKVRPRCGRTVRLSVCFLPHRNVGQSLGLSFRTVPYGSAGRIPMSEKAASNSLTLDVNRTGDTTVVRCSGKLVAGVNDLLYHEVSGLIPGSKRIVLDLTDLTHMDSTGLGTVVRLYVSAKSAGCKLELINLGKRIQQLLGVTHLLGVFTTICEHDIRMR